MSLTSQQYAYLADDAYMPYPPGPQPKGEEQNVVLGGIIYRLLDEDYFGRGVCRWKFMQAQVVFKATGGTEETEFLPYLRAKAVYGEDSEIRYFRKEIYPRDAKMDRFPSFGRVDRSKFAPDISGDDLFAIKLTSREVRP